MLLRCNRTTLRGHAPARRSRVRVCAFQVPDKLANAQPFNVVVDAQMDPLGQAEAELRMYCSNIKDKKKAERCWSVHAYYKNRWEEYRKGCEREQEGGEKAGSSCASLERWAQLARELAFSGKPSDLYVTLSALERAEKKKREEEGKPLTPEQVQSTSGMTERELLKQQYTALFHKVDKDGNGVMDVAEFCDAMKMMGDFISDKHMESIGSALDIRGVLTLEQFLDILEVEHDFHTSQHGAYLHTLSIKPSWYKHSGIKSIDDA